METIYHITTQEAWTEARESGSYKPDSLADEGFIHAGYRTQLLDVANILYPGEQGLIVLCIDPARVRAEIRADLVEFPAGQESLHPHFYGPLNTDAVFQVLDFPPATDGKFHLPPALP